jgi:DNA-binding NtrC family response regulator
VAKVLLIDDDENFCYLLKRELEQHDYSVQAERFVEDAAGALSPAAIRGWDVLLLDNLLRGPGGKKGIEILEDLRQQDVRTPAILITEHFNPNLEIRAWKLGVCDFIRKPALDGGRSLDRLLAALWKAVEAARLMKEPVIQTPDPGTEGTCLIGESRRMREVYEFVGRAVRGAARDKPVLITGEAGTGKDLIARALFQASIRSERSFLKVPCAFRNEKELEEELFGCRGNDRDRGGAFEQVNGGALLLDDLDKAHPSAQAGVRRAIRDGLIRGGTKAEAKVDVWVIACAHQEDFDQECQFRFQTRIALPPLREREDDLNLLADHFLKQAGDKEGKIWINTFTEQAREALRRHNWPGNVAELQEVVLGAVGRCQECRQVTAEDLKLNPTDAQDGMIRAHLRRAIQEASRPGGKLSTLPELLAQELVHHLEMNPEKDTPRTVEDIAALTGLTVSDVRRIIQDGEGGQTPTQPKPRRLPPSREKAWRLYQDALVVNPGLIGEPDAIVFEWLRKRSEDREGLPPMCDTFKKYLREARNHYGCPKNEPGKRS